MAKTPGLINLITVVLHHFENIQGWIYTVIHPAGSQRLSEPVKKEKE
jgi:hypothetical protein